MNITDESDGVYITCRWMHEFSPESFTSFQPNIKLKLHIFCVCLPLHQVDSWISSLVGFSRPFAWSRTPAEVSGCDESSWSSQCHPVSQCKNLWPEPCSTHWKTVDNLLQILSNPQVEKPASQKEESLSLLDLLRSTNVRNITLMLWLIWWVIIVLSLNNLLIFRFTFSEGANTTSVLKSCSHLVCRFSLNVTYFGMQFTMSSLSGNPFLNYILVTAIELPGYVVSWLATCCLPRRLSYIGFTLLGALALLLIQITLYLKSEWGLWLNNNTVETNTLLCHKVLTITWRGEGKAGAGNMPNTHNAGCSMSSVPSMLLIHLTTAHAPSHIHRKCGQVCPFLWWVQ